MTTQQALNQFLKSTKKEGRKNKTLANVNYQISRLNIKL